VNLKGNIYGVNCFIKKLKGIIMDKNILNILTWLFFFGGLFGMVMGFAKFFGSGTSAEYGVMGLGGGLWLLSSAIVIFISRSTETK
jgi:hypothetical protein